MTWARLRRRMSKKGDRPAPDITSSRFAVQEPRLRTDRKNGDSDHGMRRYMEGYAARKGRMDAFHGALFFDQRTAGPIRYSGRQRRHDSLCRMTDTVGVRPTVLSEKNTDRHGVPGAAVTLPTCTAMPGPITSGPDDPSTGSVPLAFETVFERDREPISELIKYNAPQKLTYAELQTEYEPYRHFDALKTGIFSSAIPGKTPYTKKCRCIPTGCWAT